MLKRLLVVDDEQKIRELVRKYALVEGYQVAEAEDGFDALTLCEHQSFDLVIMDLMMPHLDGFSTVKKLRESSSVPIIMLTARGEDIDKFHGFELGIDDYVVKPFSPKELMYRVQAILGRVQGSTSELLQIGDLIIDFNRRQVTLADEPVPLALKEYELLCYLVKNKTMVIERSQLLNQIWGYDFYGDDRTLDTHIKRLRQKLGQYGQHIITVRGVGYRFDETK